jgi:ATP-dependent helicase HrpB
MTIGVRLPIDDALPTILSHLERSKYLVLEATPGSGKTTRVPPALLDAPGLRGKRVLVLEPRRLAAKFAARRVAEERREPVGATVGYRFRFEAAEGPATRLLYLTEGLFLRRLATDPLLSDVGAVVLDEFHERHLDTDAALAYLRSLETKRPDLRVVAMSATLETRALVDYFGGCPEVRVETAPHPVTVEYDAEDGGPLDRRVARVVARALPRHPGDVLVFLPGMADIRRAADALADVARRADADLFPLHGELPKEEQERAILPGRRRKIVLATNVAETSLTIEGVRIVVDSGLERSASHSWWSGLPTLKTKAIARSSAIQRTGRAGRTQPGHCIRLYSKGDFDGRAPFPTPEIQRADLARLLLDLKASGIAAPAALPWLEAPSKDRLESAAALLWQLGAVENSSSAAALTTLGKKLARIPAHPRLGRLLLAGAAEGAGRLAARAAAMLGESAHERLDFVGEVRAARTSGTVERVERQLLDAVEATGRAADEEGALRRALLAAFPDRVARRRGVVNHGARTVRLVLCGGGELDAPADEMLQHGEWFLALDVRETQRLGDANVQRRASALVELSPEELLGVEPDGVVSETSVAWDAGRGRAVVREVVRYRILELERRERPAPPGPDSARLLLREGLGLSEAALETLEAAAVIQALSRVADPEALESALARVALVAEKCPESGVTVPTPDSLRAWLLETTSAAETLSDVKAIDWPESLVVAFGGRGRAVARLAPTELTLPQGRRARIHYRFGKPPWVASRLQDFFGTAEGPRILDGRLPLQLHLLAPNQRAVQVTTDLASFWRNQYPALRKELGRRYPRHRWPENPLAP